MPLSSLQVRLHRVCAWGADLAAVLHVELLWMDPLTLEVAVQLSSLRVRLRSVCACVADLAAVPQAQGAQHALTCPRRRCAALRPGGGARQSVLTCGRPCCCAESWTRLLILEVAMLVTLSTVPPCSVCAACRAALPCTGAAEYCSVLAGGDNWLWQLAS